MSNAFVTKLTRPLQSNPRSGDAAPSLYRVPICARARATSESRNDCMEALIAAIDLRGPEVVLVAGADVKNELTDDGTATAGDPCAESI